MVKPLKDYDFRLIGGVFRDIKYQEQELLTDVLTKYEIIVDDRTQFARLYDYEREIVIYYRSHGNVVTIKIWKMG